MAEGTPNVTLRYGHEVAGFTQDAEGVRVQATGPQGEASFQGQYLVGCDGGRSLVRKALGIALNGTDAMREMTQVIFWSEQLYENIKAGKGRHYALMGGKAFTAQGSRKEFTFHNSLPADSDFDTVIAEAIGFPCDVKITQVVRRAGVFPALAGFMYDRAKSYETVIPLVDALFALAAVSILLLPRYRFAAAAPRALRLSSAAMTPGMSS